MKSSPPGRRRSARALAVAAVAILAAFVLPAAAPASHTAFMGNVALLQPGCQAKGLYGFGAPSQSGTVASGAYAYTVTAIVGGAETSACTFQAVVVNNNAGPASTNSAVVQWNAVPGASGYKIYRAPLTPTGPGSFETFVFGAGPVTTVPATLVCPPSGNGPRCFFQDNGSTANPRAPLTQPTFVSPWNASERHPDVRLVQCVDYGGTALTACPNPNPATGDDPFTGDVTETAPALKADVLHFPSGLTPNPTAATACKLTGPAPSLIGDPNKYGSSDPDEDTCPRASQVGTAQTLSRSATGLTLTAGDIYVGETKGNEPGRLFVVLRPACSNGSVVAPSSATCQAVLGASNPPREVEKEFLASKSSFVKRADGSYGIDAATVRAENDGPLEPYLNVLAPNPQAGNALVRAAKTPVQVRQLTQHLFGYADQGTESTSDDKPFINLPSSCGDKGIGADKTTWEHDAISSASGPFNMPQSYCDALPFAPKLSGVASGDTAEGGYPSLDINVTQNGDEAASKVVKVTLPATLGTNLAGLQNTCTQAQFDAGQCPANSVVGSAKAASALLPGELSGPAILVAQPGSLPKLVVKLSGLISLNLEGTIDISGGSRIVNLFSNVPDVTLASFTLHVNGGPTGLLKNVKDLCDGVGNADGEFTSHGGKVATASAPIQLSGVCQPKPADIGTSKRSKVRISLSKVKSGRPAMQVVVTRGSKTLASKIRSVRLTLPKGLRIVRNDALEDRLAVKATGSGLLPLTQLVVKTRRLTVSNIPGGPVDKVTETFRRRALRSSGSLKRKGKAARPVFRVRVTTRGGKTYNYKVKAKPKS